jgi:hypothetical protein
MTKEKMNAHRVLAELKVLDSRIEGKITLLKPVVANKVTNKKLAGVEIKEFCEYQKELYQSINDLIRRQTAMKRALVLSNAQTYVNIGGVDYTVAEAIEMKNHGMKLREKLLNRLNKFYTMATNECDTENMRANNQADEFARNMLNVEKNSPKTEEYENQRKAFLANNTYTLVDAINTKAEIEKLEKEINEFMVDVDAALSAANATTEIEFEY